ncbi:v-SNARE protein [Fomitiporia mediterranea MF3/22]|uniref:v-SNARE protein n=1 Tax=Fomitiporia mediterranea (strain MF3/22) TaxID=694068 RepID=UPI0004409272|nr:v-SNARE protein [Fomitiporia mediterranea MF3/22]EJD03550.1 v-SNARE protein [Fomitiporia mediterranea MF3/22]
MSTYDNLRKQCRTLESLLDAKLTSYSRLAANAEHEDLEASGSSSRWSDLEEEVDGLLEKLRETNDQLGALLNDAASPPSQSMVWAIKRHREVLNDYERDSARTKTNVKAALDRANLLSGVRNDIDAYKSSAAESLLTERGHIDNSHQMADDILSQAYETRAEISSQGRSLGGISTRMTGVLSTMPGINNLLAMIKSRRRRDSIILGCVIGFCVLFIVNYLFR